MESMKVKEVNQVITPKDGKILAQGKIVDSSEAAQEVKTKEQVENEGANYRKTLDIIRLKNSYINQLSYARNFKARCNMIADQIEAGEIRESLDGNKKTKELLVSEYMLSKVRATSSYRQASFDRQDMFKLGLVQQDIDDLEKDYFEGPILRKEYDDAYRKKGKAEFVQG